MSRQRRTERVEAHWRQQHDSLLTVLNAILLAYGIGDQHRIAVSRAAYVGATRRNVAVETLGDRIVVYLEPVKEEDTDADTS